jgi:hypothetical protein
MKKLRASDQEKNLFIDDIIKKMFDMKTSIDDFSIDDLKKEYTKIPKNVKKPIIQVTASAYVRMLELVNQSSVECSWHGLVKRDKETNTYFIYDILVFPQINSATSTTTDEKEFAEWQMKLISDLSFPIEELRLHGHSHVNMNVFSSGIDDRYQKDLITKVEDGDYYIFFIMNKKMELCIFLYDFKQQIMFEKNDIDFQIVTVDYIGNELTATEDLRKWAKEELKEKATTEREVINYGFGRRVQTMFDDEDISYFGNTKPIFKGVKNESK